MGEESEPIEKVDGEESQWEQHAGHLVDAGDRVGLKLKSGGPTACLASLPLPLPPPLLQAAGATPLLPLRPFLEGESILTAWWRLLVVCSRIELKYLQAREG